MEDGEAESESDTLKKEDDNKEDVVVVWFLVCIEKYDIVAFNTLGDQDPLTTSFVTYVLEESIKQSEMQRVSLLLAWEISTFADIDRLA